MIAFTIFDAFCERAMIFLGLGSDVVSSKPNCFNRRREFRIILLKDC